MRKEKREQEQKKKYKTIIMVVLATILVISMSYCLIQFYLSNQNKKNYEDLEKDTTMEEISQVNNEFVGKVRELQQENTDVKGWIRIEGTNINYPLLQTTDNEFYLTHNYKKEKSKYGSIYINSNSNIKDINSNIIIYGHDMKDNQMFGDLLKYREEKYCKEHPTIKIITEEKEEEYEIVTVFKSRVFYKNEKNVFRYYQQYHFENEKQYKEYVENCKKQELYSTGKQANYGEQIITLITCEYSQENGRMVVVARKYNN